VLCLLALFLPVPLHGQASPSSREPFGELHAGLERAADLHLAQLRDNVRRAAVAPLRPLEIPTEGPDVRDAFGFAASDRWQRAQKHLQTLGVDAARIFVEEGVPPALLLVAAVESNFDPLATSPKGARGLWQLMPETAARFGLRVDEQADERTNPARSTRAAAKYLRDLYLRFGDWPLALAAYNAGEGRVEQALLAAGVRDFWSLARLRLLPEETRRYVPAVLRVGPGK